MEEPDPSWSQYPCTVLEIHQADAPDAAPLEVDLRVELDRKFAGRLRSLGLGESWAVVTAYNPHGRDRAGDGNEARHAKLLAVVREQGTAFVRADGRSPDGAHREVGLAVCLPQPDAVTLAARFGQSAIFWFDGNGFWLVSAAVPAAPVRLPAVDSTRVRST